MKFVDNKKKYSLLKLGAVVIAALVILDIIGRKYEKRYFTVPIKLRIKERREGAASVSGLSRSCMGLKGIK